MSDFHFSKLKVLIVDDETFIRQVVSRLLRQLEVRYIIEAKDGKSGFMEVVRHRPDVVLCDINMGPADGFTFLTAVRRAGIKAVADTPIIFLTADKAQETVVRAAKLQVNGYLGKPTSFNDIRDRIKAVVTKAREDSGEALPQAEPLRREAEPFAR